MLYILINRLVLQQMPGNPNFQSPLMMQVESTGLLSLRPLVQMICVHSHITNQI